MQYSSDKLNDDYVRRNKYKAMSKGAKAFLAKEASLVDYAKKIALNLKLTKKIHVAHVARTEHDASCLKEEFQLTKSSQEAILIKLNNRRNEIVVFCGKLINNELRLAVVESSLSGATAHEKKLVEDTLQEEK